MDRLDGLFRHFSVNAELFHSGPLCGINDFDARPGLGQLHLIRRGPLRVEHAPSPLAPLEIAEPTLLLYPRPQYHRFISDPQLGADMVCAQLLFSHAEINPLAQALPAVVALPLMQLPSCQSVLETLFEEAFAQRCGRQNVLNRLFEVVLIQLLRELLNHGSVKIGLLAGLADLRLAPLLVAIHEAPAAEWSLARMAATALMSRSSFAAHFVRVLGITPAEYVQRWRLLRTTQLLQRGLNLKQIAPQVGYSSPAALSRAMRTRASIAEQ
jgi:AraC-like DNA-binding protein